MPRFKAAILLVLFTLVPAVGQTQQSVSNNSDFASGREIDRILAEIQVALINVQNTVGISSSALPQLESVSLELKTEFGANAKGELNLYVVSADGKVEKENTQRLSIKLKPPKPGTEQPIAAGDVTESISTAILAAAKGIAAAKKRKPPLNTSKIEVEVQFVVKGTGSAGVKFELLPITVGMKGEIKSSSIQTATVTFQTAEK